MGHPPRPRIPDYEWESQKSNIVNLYVEEQKNLQYVIEVMERDHKFSASKSQYETRLQKWNIHKYTKAGTWVSVDNEIKKRKAEGKESEVILHGRPVKKKKLLKETARHLSRPPTQTGIQSTSTDSAMSSLDVRTPPMATFSLEVATPQGTHPFVLHDASNLSPVFDFFGNATAPFQLTSSDNTSSDISFAIDQTPFSSLDTGTSSINHKRYDEPSPQSLIRPKSVLSDSFDFTTGSRLLIQGLGKSTVEFFTHSPSATVLLPHVNPRIFQIARAVLDGLGLTITLPDNAANLSQRENIGQSLAPRTPEAHLLHAVASKLINGSFDHRSDPESPFSMLNQAVLEGLHNLPATLLKEFLADIPSSLSKALTEGLFWNAVELGASGTLKVVLEEGFNIARHCVNREYDLPIKRTIELGHVEATRVLLDRASLDGYKPSHGLMEVFLEGCEEKGTIDSSAHAMFAVLLGAGAPLQGANWHLRRFTDTSIFSTMVDNFTGSIYDLCINTGYLSTLYSHAENELAYSVTKDLIDHYKNGKNMTFRLKDVIDTSFPLAIRRKNYPALDLLLQNGAQPNVGHLSTAVNNDDIVLVKWLLDLGVVADEIPVWDRPSPLVEAIHRSNRHILEIFELHGYLANKSGDPDHAQAVLIAACCAKNRPLVDVFLPHLKSIALHARYRISALIRAITMLGEKEVILQLIEILDLDTYYYVEILETAIEMEDVELTWFFLDAVPKGDISGQLLKLAVEWGNIDIIKEVCNRRTLSMVAPLIAAIRKSNYQIVRVLLEAGSVFRAREAVQDEPDDVNEEDDNETAIEVAVKCRNSGIVKELILQGADPHNSQALRSAVAIQDYEMVDFLLRAYEHRYAYRSKNISFGSSALRKAIRIGDLRMVKLLAKLAISDGLQRDDDDSVMDPRKSHLGEAIGSSHSSGLAILRVLLQNGVNPDGVVWITSNWGTTKTCYDPTKTCASRTALMHAIVIGEIVHVQELIKHGANCNLPAKQGIERTPLQYAAEIGATKMIQYLLDKKADPNSAPSLRNGGTALQLAARTGAVGNALLLLQAGAEVNSATSRIGGKTAFEGATEHGRIDMMLLLVQNGADLVSDKGKQYSRAIELAEKNGKIAARDLAEQLYFTALRNAEDEGVTV